MHQYLVPQEKLTRIITKFNWASYMQQKVKKNMFDETEKLFVS